jgi:uncharacterized protein YfaP (DUF2135 family)
VGAAKALVNDLDLEVLAPDGSTLYYGNAGVYSGGQCLRNGKSDACNNAESVLLSSAPSGLYRVRVKGFNVPQGVRQPFAITVSGNYAHTPAPTSPGNKRNYLPVTLGG